MSPAYLPEDLDEFSPAIERAVDSSMVPYRGLALAIFNQAREDRDYVSTTARVPFRERRPGPRRGEQAWDFKRRLAGWITRQQRYVKRWAAREGRQAEAGAFIVERGSLWHELLADVIPSRRRHELLADLIPSVRPGGKSGPTSESGRQH